MCHPCPNAAQQPCDLVIGCQILQDAKWRDDQIEGLPKIKARDVAELHDDVTWRDGGLSEFCLTNRQHRLRELDSMNGAAALRQGEGDSARATPQFENARVLYPGART